MLVREGVIKFLYSSSGMLLSSDEHIIDWNNSFRAVGRYSEAEL